MSGGPPELGASEVEELLAALSARLEAEGTEAHLFIVGGAAMALAYDRDRVTRDVDAIFEPAVAVRRIVADLGMERDLEPDWLNDAAKGFMPGDDPGRVVVFESESLLVEVPSAGYLLAMKLHASRDEGDLDDAVVLFRELELKSGNDALDVLTSHYPLDRLLPRHTHLAEEVARRAQTGNPRRQAKADELLHRAARRPESDEGRGLGR